MADDGVSIFRRVVEAIKAAYPAAAERIGAESIEVPEWRIGRIEALEHKRPPYIAWIRGSVLHRPPTKPSSVQADGQSVDRLVDMQQLVTAIICGSDEHSTEQIWYAALNAVRDALGGINPQLYGPATWMTQEEGNAGYIHAGAEVVVQEFNWSLIVPYRIDALTVITATEHDCEGIVP